MQSLVNLGVYNLVEIDQNSNFLTLRTFLQDRCPNQQLKITHLYIIQSIYNKLGRVDDYFSYALG